MDVSSSSLYLFREALELPEESTLEALKSLHIGFSSAPDDILRALMRHPSLHSLESLSLSSNTLTSSLGELGSAIWKDSLRSLDLGYARELSLEHFVSMVESGALESLETLKLQDSRLGDEHIEVLARASWPRLEHLELWKNRIGVHGARALAELQAPCLRELDVHQNSLGGAGVMALLEASFVPSLRSLLLHENQLDDHALEALTRCDELGLLEVLDLSEGHYDWKALAELVLRHHRSGWRFLIMRNSELGHRHVRALFPAEHDTPLCPRLYLAWNQGIDDEAARWIAAHPALSQITWLSLAQCGLTEQGARALLDSPHVHSGLRLELTDVGFSRELRERIQAHGSFSLVGAEIEGED